MQNTTQFFSADQLFFEADKKIKEKLYADAVPMLEEALKIDPEHSRALNHLAWVYDRQFQDYLKAEELYKRSLACPSVYPAAYTNYANLLNVLKKDKELEQHIKQSMDVPGVNVTRLNEEYGYLLERLQRYSEAIDAFKIAYNTSFSKDDMAFYKEAIERCEEKATFNESKKVTKTKKKN